MRLVTFMCLLLIAPIALTSGAYASASSDRGGTELAGSHVATLAKARVRVSLTTTTPYVKKGGIASLKGRVRGARGRQIVRIMQRNSGARSWVVEATKRTSRKGVFRHREDVNSGTRLYKACVKRRCSESVKVHMGKQPTKPTAVSIGAVAPTTIEAGQAFTVSGSASANLNGRMVEIQAFDSGSDSWGVVGSASVTNGAWAGTASVSTAGRAIPVRASFSGGIGLARSSSTAATISVYGWFYLKNFSAVAQNTGLSGGSYNVNGVNYPQSIGLWFFSSRTAYLEYDLSRSCTRFAATVGVADYAPSSEKVAGSVIIDNVTKWSQTRMGLGQAYPITLDITAGLRLRVEATPEVYGSDADLIFGDARVLCAP